METIPPLNIIGVYMEPTSLKEVAKATQKLLIDKVQKRVDIRENCMIVGDTNAADCNKLILSAKQMLAWERPPGKLFGF